MLTSTDKMFKTEEEERERIDRVERADHATRCIELLDNLACRIADGDIQPKTVTITEDVDIDPLVKPTGWKTVEITYYEG
jgi:hypothetical protein